ncbi:MAG: Tm-1-like ATP-binding domain-containing protein [Beutenbergiaceae bacterium]
MAKSAVVAVVGTMDTKGSEHAYVCDVIRASGVGVLTIDTGILGEPRGIQVDITASEVARAAGTDLEAVRTTGQRGPAVETMERGLRTVVQALSDADEIHGIVTLGGAEGTVLGARVMQMLPLGMPKVLVSAVANGARTFGQYVGGSDLFVVNSVVDCAGLNRLSREVFANAGAAVAAMAQHYHSRHLTGSADEAPVVAVSILGNTQGAFDNISRLLQAQGYETIPFHANGSGGMSMEQFAADGHVDVIVDLTLNEVSNHVIGGVTAAPESRMRLPGRRSVPQVVVPGCLDLFTFGSLETLPMQFRDRQLYRHNPHFTLIRANAAEMAAFGREVASRINDTTAPLYLVWPQQGLSIEDAPGGQFWAPEADAALREALLENLTVPYEWVEVDANVNDEATAEAICSAVQDLHSTSNQGPSTQH